MIRLPALVCVLAAFAALALVSCRRTAENPQYGVAEATESHAQN